MTNRSFLSPLFLLVSVFLLAVPTYAETFEFLTYTPPTGWTKEITKDAVVYKRPSGVGAIALYNGYATDASAASEFARIWTIRVGGIVRGPAPQPTIQRDGDFSIAVGAQRVTANDGEVSISLVAFVGRGRAVGLTTLSSGADALREVSSFLDSVKIVDPVSPPPAKPPVIDIEYDMPPQYVAGYDKGSLVFTPREIRATPCVYGLSPSRPSSGNLEADARAAILEPIPGWQIKGERYEAIRGVGGGGWPYFQFRTDVQQLNNGSYQYLRAMSTAISTGPGRVGIFWGFGDPAHCTLDDAYFARFLLGLKPKGWTSDEGRSLARDLIGTWRNSQSVGIAQYKFLAGGRYEYGLGTVTRMGIFETTASSSSDGSYQVVGSSIYVTPRGRNPKRYEFRIYDEFVAGRWTRAFSLLDDNGDKPLDVQYMRVEP